MADTCPLSSPRSTGDRKLRDALKSALPLVLIFLTGIVFRHFLMTNWDVSWLITVGEKMLDGQRFGRDILEINPPASALLYMPAILIARVLGITPELVIDALTFAAIGVSLALSARIVATTKAVATIDGGLLAAIAAAILAILPAFSFSQREHIAVIALLPLVAMCVRRAEGDTPRAIEAILAGFGSGVAVAIKPYFVLAVLFAAAASAMHARSWRPILALENWIGAAIALLYAASVFMFFPDYISNVLPMVRDLYLPDRLPWLGAIFHPAMLLWLAVLAFIVVLRPKGIFELPCSILAATAAGFAVSFVLQGKGWPYHAYPMFAFALLAVGCIYASNKAVPFRPRWLHGIAALALAALIVKLCLWFNTSMNTRMLAEAIEAMQRQPRIALIGSEIVLGHPLVRELKGTWVNRDLGQWITTGVMRRRENGARDSATQARLDSYEALDHAALADDIARGRPDIVIVDRRDFDWLAWARADAATRSALAGYREAQNIEGIAIFRRVER